MPHSLVINLTPLSPISPNYLNGRHIHALFLTLVSHVDQQLGNTLHHSQSDKAFTLSPLQIIRRNANYHNLKWLHYKAIPLVRPVGFEFLYWMIPYLVN
uniref:hypothetical protein n=1 Tax=Cyanothece sp. BG0011 TaxID=2082950 RepID=UPI0030DCE004